MNTQAILEGLIDEYLKEPESFQYILLNIENHQGHFFIVDRAWLRLTGLVEQSDKFQLAIYFSFNNTTKMGKAIGKRVEQSTAFKDFKKITNKNSAVFVANTNNNKKDICQTIENIIRTTFPSFDISNIKIELKKKGPRFTIQ